ncbi:hypothetical protein [Paenibacillus massiliensis]|uniref:hypothetical protein n=1 Tax=Paenibacillus massiliensis TaxID=225917 RepID=UPI00046F2F5F|nr:hypothetical protein [Paenibacillus massiliensis]
MNRRQRQKYIPSLWIIAEKIHTHGSYFALYAIDWKRGGRLSWEGWQRLEDLLQFRIPLKRRAGGRKLRCQPGSKIVPKALHLRLDESQYDELERLFYQPFSPKRWREFIRVNNCPFLQ